MNSMYSLTIFLIFLSSLAFGNEHKCQNSSRESFIRQYEVPKKILVTSSCCKLTLFNSVFDKKKNKLKYGNDRAACTIFKINDKKYSGSDGSLPAAQIDFIHLKIRNKDFKFPEEMHRTLFNFHNKSLKMVENKGSLEISGKGGDGAGSYDVKWLIDIQKSKIEMLLYEFPNKEKPKRTSGKLSI